MMIDYAALKGGRARRLDSSDISSCSSEDTAGGVRVWFERRSLRAELFGSSSKILRSD
jgi:hypothetical protein